MTIKATFSIKKNWCNKKAGNLYHNGSGGHCHSHSCSRHWYGWHATCAICGGCDGTRRQRVTIAHDKEVKCLAFDTRAYGKVAAAAEATPVALLTQMPNCRRLWQYVVASCGCQHHQCGINHVF